MTTDNQLALLSNLFPVCNVYSFIFSNPFSSSRVTDALSTKSNLAFAKLPPIPSDKIIFQDSDSPNNINYSTLRHNTLRLASGIRERFGIPSLTRQFGCGSVAGPVVLIHLPNCIEWPIIALGFLAAGWTVTGSNPSSTVPELTHIIKLCQPRVIICQSTMNGKDIIQKACISAHHKEVDIFLAVPSRDPRAHQSESNSPGDAWTTLLSDYELKIEPFLAKEANNRLALILWSSGTTGKYKGAMLTHRAVISGLVILWMGHLGYSAEEQWIGVPPFYHIFGLYLLALMAPCIGATVTLQPRFDLTEYLRLATKYKSTMLIIPPPIAVALANYDFTNNPPFSLKSVRSTVVGGAPLSPAIIRRLWERQGLAVKQAYGMSEVGAISMFKTNNWEEVKSRLSSCGISIFPGRIRIVGANGEHVGNNNSGEIVIQSPGQMLGYLKNPEATAETIHPDGVHTGDIGYIDDEGYLTISGRSKEIIKYKAFQVSPSEIEAVISSLSDVQDVAVSSVYSEAQGTELPIAHVVPRNSTMMHSANPIIDLAALADAVRLVVENNLIHYKRLRGGITFVSEIPKTPSGKIIRTALKNLKGTHIDCYAKLAHAKL